MPDDDYDVFSYSLRISNTISTRGRGQSIMMIIMIMVIMMMMMMMMMIMLMRMMTMMIIMCFLHPKGPQTGLAPGGADKL